MDSEFIELKAIVRGLVQGVGFRYITRQLATQLNLHGTVRNCSDGSVEIIAQGTRAQVDGLLSQLKNTPGLGRIDAIESVYRLPESPLVHFQIIHSQNGTAS